MRAELAKEEAEKAAQAESRKAEIMAGKIISTISRQYFYSRQDFKNFP